MNVGHPSNLARLVSLYGGMMDEKGTILRPADMDAMRNEIFALSISDEQTRETIRKVYAEYHATLEPHGAVGWSGLMEYLKAHPNDNRYDQLCVSLETAHPAKFPEEISRLLGIDPDLPASLEGLDGKPEHVTSIPAEYQDFKQYLIRTF